MKKILLILTLLSANICFSQQKSYYTQPHENVEINKILQTKDKKIWYIGKSIENYNSTFVGCLDSNFKEINFWGYPITPTAEVFTIVGLKPYDNTSLLICLNRSACDVNYNYGSIGILNYKSNKFQKNVDEKEGYKKLFPTEDGGFAHLPINEGYINIFNEASLNFENFNLNDYADFAYVTDEQIYFCNQGGNFYSIDKSGNNKLLLGASPLPNWAEYNHFQVIEKNKKIAITSKDSLYFIDFQKNTIKKVSTIDKYTHFSSLKYFKEDKRLYVASKGKVQVFDDNFNLISTQLLEDKLSVPNDIFKVNGVIYFAGKTVHTPQNIKEPYAFKDEKYVGTIRPLSAAKVPSSDAALLSAVSQNDPPIVLLIKPQITGVSTLYSSDFGEVKITVKNTGNDTIRSLNLNTGHEGFGAWCFSEEIFMWKFDNLQIAPNEEKTLTLNQVKFPKIYGNKNDGACFWLSLVNGKPDANATNDFVCKPFQTTVSASDVASVVENISVFPNPSDGNFTISSPEETISNVTVFDAVGKNVFSQNVDNQDNTTLNVSFLPQGIYTFRVKKERTTSIVKIVIQH